MVDYEEIARVEHWADMKVSQKLQSVLFVLYVHDNNVNAWDWKVVKTFLWSPNASQSERIQADYEIMRKKSWQAKIFVRVIIHFLQHVPNMAVDI